MFAYNAAVDMSTLKLFLLNISVLFGYLDDELGTDSHLLFGRNFDMQWTLCLLGVICVCKLKETVSSTCLKCDYEKPYINFNAWNYNFLASPLSFCKRFRAGQRCCEFECLDEPDPTDGFLADAPMNIAFSIASSSAGTLMLIAAVILLKVQ